ncbi:hypothetical protein [Corynebacterium casei]|uniref:hypothetical protein n=1 Tax=Corynebacterium casei TaxID=160386 RepID=UPI003F945350
MLSQGISLHRASIQLGCIYAHARNFVYIQSLIDYRPHTMDPQLVDVRLDLVKSGLTVNAVAATVGVNNDALRRRAYAAEPVKPIGQYQRKQFH